MELKEIEKLAKEIYSSVKLQNNWSECINFAFYLLDNKIESENIYILAGLDKNDYDSINKYFLFVITELGIKKIDEDINYNFLCYLGRRVQNNEIDPFCALTILEQMYYKRKDERFLEWISFGDAVDLVENGVNDYYMYEINNNNLSEYIKEKILLDIELYKDEIPEHFYEMGFCEKCNELVIPEVKKHFFTKKSFYQCSKCKSKNANFLWCIDNKGKKLYLEMKKHNKDSKPITGQDTSSV